CLQGTHFPFTF
nr:immunoglobulin light chain junction region [Mus musculus]